MRKEKTATGRRLSVLVADRCRLVWQRTSVHPCMGHGVVRFPRNWSAARGVSALAILFGVGGQLALDGGVDFGGFHGERVRLANTASTLHADGKVRNKVSV